MNPYLPTEPSAEMAALLQQLLLAQGGRYTSVVEEGSWKHTPTVMHLPEGEDLGQRLPVGTYLVLPWDITDAARLKQWLEGLFLSGVRPDHIILISSLVHASEVFLQQLSDEFGCQFAAIQTQTLELVGPPLMTQRLAVLLDPETPETAILAIPGSSLSDFIAMCPTSC
jgi:hypothetical protein